MKCRDPYLNNGMVHSCGRCMPCRINKRRIWTHRIMLESLLHGDNCMVTLTYAEDVIPHDENGRGILKPKDLQDWLKRFRKSIEPLRVRYFACGEYGDVSWRPHFHAILFGYPNCLYGQSRYSSRKKNCCINCDRVRDTWRHGNVFVCELSDATAQYVSGYVTKKMTKSDDFRLKGLPPEFARMSLKPGIGADMMHEIASKLMEFNLDEKMDDVPSSLMHGKNRVLPIGRYLQRKLRTLVGKSPDAPQSVKDALALELLPLREAAFDNSRSFKKEIISAADQAVLNMEAKQKIRKVRRTI